MDIVERLRDLTYVLRPYECNKAADIIEKLCADNKHLRAENERLNTALSDVAYCDTPGENDEHCEREDGDLCPFSGWYDGPLCSITGMYIGDDPRNP